MKINVLLFIIFFSVIIYSSSEFLTGIVGTTPLNGEGCVCHSASPGTGVKVWIDGPDTVLLGQTVLYRIYLSGGSAVAGGFNVAAFSGNISPVDSSVIEIENELTHNNPQAFPSSDDTIFWQFSYTAASLNQDTLYSAANSVNGNGNPSGDEWNSGIKFPVFVSPSIPVELVSFTGITGKNGVILKWETASELNNDGFEIQKSINNIDFFSAGFVKGRGTSAVPNFYSYVDLPDKQGIYYYRLKQFDFNSSYSLSDTISVDFTPTVFGLYQNYPNPFNPETNITFSIPEDGYIQLEFFDVKGELVDILSARSAASGNYSVNWNAALLPSGVYFCRLIFTDRSGSEMSDVKKMILNK